MKRFTGLVWLCLFFIHSYGQMFTAYRAETFGSAATGAHTPFWLVNHRWGVAALDANNFYVRGGLFHEQMINQNWTFDAGIDIVGGNHSSYGNVWLQQLYGRLNWKILRLDVGVREDYQSLFNPLLSSGDFMHSNHARPIPQIRGGFSDFVLVPRTKGKFYIKGDISVGAYLDGKWIEDRAYPTSHNYSKGALAHSKTLYFRLGNIENQSRQQLTWGLDHRVHWGGTVLHEDWLNPGIYTIHKQPQNLDALFRAMFAMAGSSASSAADQAFVSGHHWGAYLLKYDYKFQNNQRISAYIQHFFEDGTGMVLVNYPDNLYGLEWRSPKESIVSGVVFEFIYTKQQSGTMHFGELGGEYGIPENIKGGNDNYYNNVDYAQGPSYFGKSLGTPLFLSPEYNTDGSVNFKGSRIKAFHLGMEGYLRPSLQYRLLLSTGQNWGRYYEPFTYVHKGFASKLELTYTFPETLNMDIRLEVGYDTGDFFGGQTFGGGVTLIKRGFIGCGCR